MPSMPAEKTEVLFQDAPKGEDITPGKVNTPAPSREEPKAAEKPPMTEEVFFAKMDDLITEMRESGADYMGKLLLKYGLREGHNFVENMIEYGFSKNRGK